MDWSQIGVGAAIFAALWIGKPSLRLAVVMVADFCGTLAFSASPVAVAVVDMAAVPALVMGSRREKAVAALFAIMVIVESIAAGLQIQNGIIYTVTDALALLQCGVIGGADRALGGYNRPAIGRGLGTVLSVAVRYNPGAALARIGQADRGGLNG